MKKIYVMAAFLGASSFAFNQVVSKAPSQLTKHTGKAIMTNNGVNKAPGTSLWSSDFSDETEWVLEESGPQGEWIIGDENDFNSFQFNGQTADLSNFMNIGGMTTAGNGYAFFDAIQFHAAGDIQNAWVAMADDVDSNGESKLTLKFEQQYRAFNDDVTYVEVSLDGGTTWEQSTDVNPNVAGNADAENTIKYINFDVNGSSEVRFRFRWESSADGGYGWQVDDVEVMTLADNDISTSSLNYGTAGLFYHQIPVAQIAAIESAVVVKNEGLNDLTNVVLTAEETAAGYVSTSAPVSLASETEDSVVVQAPFTPTNQGDYQIDFSISSDATDDVPSNNQLKPYRFVVGLDIYARDSSTQAENGTRYGQTSGANRTPAKTIEPGNAFDIFADADLTGIDFQLGNIISEGSLVYGTLYDTNLDPVPGGETQPYTVQAGDENSYHTLVFENPVSLTAGETYVVAVKSFDVDFSVATAGASLPQTSFVFYASDDEWFYTTSTPVVRMNFDPTLSVENNELSNMNVSANYPNPFANETTVEFSLKEAADVSYSVVDLTGKVLTEVTKGNTLAGDHAITIDGSSFANGVYYLNLKAGESTVTRKIVVNK